MNDTTNASAIFGPIWHRKWLILAVAVLVGVGSYFYYRHQPKKFQTQTELYLQAGSEEQQAEKGIGGKLNINGQAQAQLITTVVHETVRKQLKAEHGKVAKQAAKGKVRAKAGEKSAFITITTEARSGKASALLANTIAQTYIRRQHAQYQRGLRRTIAIARRQLKRVETPHVLSRSKSGSATKGLTAGAQIQAATLNSKINQLESLLNVKAVAQINPAKPKAAVLLGPKPKQNAIFGFVLGLILTAIVVFALSRVNRRLAAVAELESAFGLPVLAVLPQVKKPIVRRDDAPAAARALVEPLRQVDTALRLAGMTDAAVQNGGPCKSVLVISAEPGEGKSSLVAGLALVEREAGARTTIVEANLRQPVMARLLDLEGTRGVIEAISGSVPRGVASQTVRSGQAAAATAEQQPGGAVATAVAGEQPQGAVSVLVGAGGTPNPQALLASGAMADLLRSATAEQDHVLVDGPSPLVVSDVLPLLPVVQGIIVVARLGYLRESSARRLRQLLDRTPSAPLLGVVANGVGRRELKRYGTVSAPRRRLFRR
jgi:Mrp family chromosome partitioning ATPase